MFPTVGENSQQPAEPDITSATTNQTSSMLYETATTPCNCPRRRTPPPKPTDLPFPATEDNRENLQYWLLDYYNSSTFNTCEHQTLPLMSSQPNSNPTPLARTSESWIRPRGSPGCNRTSACGRTRHMVSQDGGLCEEKW